MSYMWSIAMLFTILGVIDLEFNILVGIILQIIGSTEQIFQYPKRLFSTPILNI
jgi:hypothetical protein